MNALFQVALHLPSQVVSHVLESVKVKGPLAGDGAGLAVGSDDPLYTACDCEPVDVTRAAVCSLAGF